MGSDLFDTNVAEGIRAMNYTQDVIPYFGSQSNSVAGTILDIGYEYYLAEKTSLTSYGTMVIGQSGGIFDYDGNLGMYCYGGLRPIVTLKSSVNVTEKSGNVWQISNN